MDNFEIQRKSMTSESEKTVPDVPKLGKNTTVAKWDNTFKVHAAQVYGSRKSTLEYLLRTNVAVAAPHPGLMKNCPHSEAAGSIQGEMTLRLSHTHPLYRNDNKALYEILEEALRGTTYEASIKSFRRANNGREPI